MMATTGAIDNAQAPSFGLLKSIYSVIPVILTTLSIENRKNHVCRKIARW
jgi:hypothetical protein